MNDSCSSTSFSSLEYSWKIPFGVIDTVISLTAIIENTLALTVILKYKELYNVSNCILTSLIITDLCAGLSAAPLQAIQLLFDDLTRHCKIEEARRSIVAMLVGTSALTIATISYDRYLHLTQLYNYDKYMTKRKAGVLIILSWCIPVILPVLRLKDTGNKENAYIIFFTTLMVLTFISLLVFYVMILSSLRQRATWRRRSLTLEQKQLRTFRTIMIIITCFVVMGFPITIAIIVKNYSETFGLNAKTNGRVYVVSLTLNLLNSAANPVIYYYSSPSIKKCAKRLLRLDHGNHRVSAYFDQSRLPTQKTQPVEMEERVPINNNEEPTESNTRL